MRTTLLLSLVLATLTACNGVGEPTDADLDGSPVDEDCDDADATAFPGAVEVCDGVDNDCDGTVDVAATDASTWYLDEDGDGAGASGVGVQACEQLANHVASGDDCNDSDPAFFPGATELCDGADNDCDGETDEAGADGEVAWYADADGDTFGDLGVTATACDAPSGYVADDADCDDADAAVNPDASELCNDVDDDCDVDIDEDAIDKSLFYEDADGDGFGHPDASVEACDAPTTHVSNADDCDDSSAAVSPNGTEVPDNSIDDNCDGNQPPEPAPLVEISPASPGEDQDLVCQLASDSATVDPDGDAISYLYAWKVDGEVWDGLTSTTVSDGDTIASEDTVLGEVWTCEITPTDSSELGTMGTADAKIADWLNLTDGASCSNWQGSGVTEVFCGEVTSTYEECETLCGSLGTGSMVHWGNANGDYVSWGSAVSVAYELCFNDTTCDDEDDDNFWSKYSPSQPQEFCQGDNRMTCESSWWTAGTGPTQCFCYR